MRNYSAADLSNSALHKEAEQIAGGERSHQVRLLVLIAEIDARKLYLPAGYPTMSAYCVERFRLTEDEAERRLYASRTARLFPTLFEALDEGRLCLTAVCLLAPHLTAENVGSLVQAAAACRRMSELRAFLQRFTKPDLLDSASAPVVDSPVPERVTAPLGGNVPAELAVPPLPEIEVDHLPVPERVSAPLRESDWVELRVKVRKSKLQHARDLLSHTVPSGNATAVFDRALDALIARLENRKYAACKKPRASRPRAMERHRGIPADVRRAVWERDGGQCTFPGDTGRRCGTRRQLEFDHIVPVARGGKATVENLRLRCRAHNQYTAEQEFGAEYMRHKREQARVRAAMPLPPGHRFRDDVIARLRALGVSHTEARLVLERSGALQQTTLEESMRAALQCLGPRRRPPS